MSSLQSSQEGDSSSSLSSSSEESSDGGESDEHDIITVGGPKKPAMSMAHDLSSGAVDLRARVSALLPQLAAANTQLTEGDANTWSMEDVRDDEQHIEMDLGLGVLEEIESNDSDTSEEPSEEEPDATMFPDAVALDLQPETHVLDRLMHVQEKSGRHERVGIEEMG
jgi:hypothetical protein